MTDAELWLLLAQYGRIVPGASGDITARYRAVAAEQELLLRYEQGTDKVIAELLEIEAELQLGAPFSCLRCNGRGYLQTELHRCKHCWGSGDLQEYVGFGLEAFYKCVGRTKKYWTSS